MVRLGARSTLEGEPMRPISGSARPRPARGRRRGGCSAGSTTSSARRRRPCRSVRGGGAKGPPGVAGHPRRGRRGFSVTTCSGYGDLLAGAPALQGHLRGDLRDSCQRPTWAAHPLARDDDPALVGEATCVDGRLGPRAGQADPRGRTAAAACVRLSGGPLVA